MKVLRLEQIDEKGVKIYLDEDTGIREFSDYIAKEYRNFSCNRAIKTYDVSVFAGFFDSKQKSFKKALENHPKRKYEIKDNRMLGLFSIEGRTDIKNKEYEIMFCSATKEEAEYLVLLLEDIANQNDSVN